MANMVTTSIVVVVSPNLKNLTFVRIKIKVFRHPVLTEALRRSKVITIDETNIFDSLF